MGQLSNAPPAGYDPRMAVVLQPWQILVAGLAGWISRQQDAVIDYLREENRVLKQQLGRRRLCSVRGSPRFLSISGLINSRAHYTPRHGRGFT